MVMYMNMIIIGLTHLIALNAINHAKLVNQQVINLGAILAPKDTTRILNLIMMAIHLDAIHAILKIAKNARLNVLVNMDNALLNAQNAKKDSL